MAHIAFLGTGLLGSAFAEAATKRGDTVVAWNRTPGKVEALAAFGVKAAVTPADAVNGATRVHLVLKDDSVVEEVIAAALPGLKTETVLIDHSTTLPALTTQRAARLQEAGVKYLHCPVFMGPPAARNAQGTMLVSGPRSIYETVKDDLAKMTGRVEYLGERQDLAAANKLLGNAVIIGLSAVMADVLTLAQASQIDGKDALALVKLLDLNAMVNGRGANMASGNFTPSFELAMARKDVGLMLQTAGNRPLATLPGIEVRMEELIAQGHGAADAAVLGIDAVKRS
jgi:3-hydroxyisobutyrate dehydrogenase